MADTNRPCVNNPEKRELRDDQSFVDRAHTRTHTEKRILESGTEISIHSNIKKKINKFYIFYRDNIFQIFFLSV